jgi:hypothetical protein
MVALGFDLGYYVKVQHGIMCFYLQNMLIQTLGSKLYDVKEHIV